MPFSKEDLAALGDYAIPKEEKQKPAAASSLDKDSALQDYLTPNAPMVKAQFGKSWQLPDDISPLSPMERAAFGYTHPTDRMKFLEGRYGKGNVQVSKTDENGANFLVKDDAGGVHQVDPHGISDIPMDVISGNVGQAMNRIKNFNLRNTIGGAAQFAGEKGAVSLAAAAGGGAAMAEASPLLAAGPVGMLGVLGAGVAGGVAGAGAASYADAGIKEALASAQDLTGEQLEGAHHYSKDDLSQQVMGDMLFGGAQELASPFLKAAGKGVAEGASKVFASTMDYLGDTPQSKQAIATAIRTFSGFKPGFARAWADDPQGVSDFIPIAKGDALNNTTQIRTMQKEALNEAIDQAQEKMRGPIGKQYEAIQKAAQDKQFFALQPLKGTGSNPITDGLKELQQGKYLDNDLNIVPEGDDVMTRDVSGTNKDLLNSFVKGYKVLENKGPGGASSYQDLNLFRQNLDNHLYSTDGPKDDNLARIMTNIRQGIQNVQSEGLHEVDPQLANQLAQVNAKYGPAKEILRDLGKVTDKDKRVEAFIRNLHKDDGSYAKGMMDSLSNVLGTDNPTKDIVNMEVARQSVPWFTDSQNKMKLGPVTLPTTSLTRGVMDNVVRPAMQPVEMSEADQTVMGALKKMSSVYRGLPAGLKADFMKNPQTVSAVGDMISGAAVQAETNKSQLLKQAGAFQNSQFGTPP